MDFLKLQFKDYKINVKIAFFVLILFTLLFSACGRKNPLSLNSQPQIRITSSYGVEEIQYATDDTISFQQTIHWKGEDSDGSITGYAFRVLNASGEPIITSGYEYTDADGWILHYQEGADESIPMSDPYAQLTIWNAKAYATINFPANIDGDSTNVVSLFEVKCRDNRNLESNSVIKYFNVFSMQPSVTISTTSGNIDGKTIGLGIILEFTMNDSDPYVDPIPDHFLFKLEKRDFNNTIVDENGYGEWISTKDQNNVSLFRLSQNTSPHLYPNSYANNEPVDSTYLLVKAIDMAGIESKTDTISFLIKEGFSPKTLIYIRDTFVLGENHFVPNRDESLNKDIPSLLAYDGIHYSTPFWIDKNGDFTALNGSNLRIYLHWGWHGEFEADNPFEKKDNNVLDAITDSSYFSKIEYFDIRLDDLPFSYAPFPPEGENLFVDPDGKAWLRVPIQNEIAQNTVLSELNTGTHKFEVRAVDLQGIASVDPAVLDFELIEPLQKEERSGILIIDDDPHHSVFAPDDVIDEFYNIVLSDFSGEIVQIERDEIYDIVHSDSIDLGYLHFNKSVFSPTDLQNYKLIIYHSDNVFEDSNFGLEYDPMNLYLHLNGNLVFSCGTKIIKIQEYLIDSDLNFLNRYFGIPLMSDAVNCLNFQEVVGSFIYLQFLDKALPQEGNLDEIYLQLPSMVNSVTLKEGLGPVVYFDVFDSSVIYSFGCKEPAPGTSFNQWDDVDDIDQFPSLNQFGIFNGKPVALQKQTENNNCLIFGFPLSFMVEDDVKNALNNLLNEIN